ncbi:MAG: FAD-dependent oxidoreductase [Steroidobacteraceae bacterium]
MTQAWDAIVIGSGIGGMSAAALLAKVGGMRVLVLEKQSERGGLTHVFRRDGASWDVGVHYLGNMQIGSDTRALFDFMSGGALEWNAMPDEFERFIYPGLDFAVPSDAGRYQDRLIERFPAEAASIRRYFADVNEVAEWNARRMIESIPPPAVPPAAQACPASPKAATHTTGEYLDRHFRSAELKALLATQWGDYGLPPSESAFVLHAIVVRSYLRGGWFPKGGASRIARTFELAVEAAGGAITVCCEVTGILTEGTRVIGVKALDRRGAEPIETVFSAPIVISDAGAEVTYERLLPVDGEIGRRTAGLREVIDRLSGGLSAVTLYLRLNKPVAALGVKGENYWINTTFEQDDIEAQTAAVLAGKPKHVYMSFPAMKSGDDRFSTAEILALVEAKAFSAWRGTAHGMRGTDYLELKSRIAQGLLDLAETATPGLKAMVQYSELSTPLTVEDYTSHPGGAFYGLKGTPERFTSNALLAPPPISGLYLSGCDAWSLGVAGSLMGGVVAAGRALGQGGFSRIMASVHNAKSAAATPTTGRSPNKKRAVLVGKTALTPSMWRLEFQLDEPISCTPGQYVMLRVAPFEWRCYSIASDDGRRFTLLVSTRTGGDGSIFARTVQPGAETQVELPFGAFGMQRNSHRKVFIATGTGLAPFLSMFAAMAAAGELESAELLFGCGLAKEDITRDLAPLPRTTVCVDGDPSAQDVFQGKVTQALAHLAFDPAATDFYLCGSAAMTSDCRSILARAGATRVLAELF